MPKSKSDELTVDWYPRRWLADTADLTAAAKGAWVHTLNKMMVNDTYSLTATYADLARSWGCAEGEAGRIVEELRRFNVADIKIGENDSVTLKSRLRERQHKLKADNALRQQRARDKRERNAAGNGDVTLTDSSLSVFLFDSDLLRGPGEDPWYVTQQMHDGWVGTYPDLVHLTEYRKAAEWLKANPTLGKTRRGMRRFLNGWLNRAQNNAWRSSGPGKRPATGVPPPEQWKGTERPDDETGE